MHKLIGSAIRAALLNLAFISNYAHAQIRLEADSSSAFVHNGTGYHCYNFVLTGFSNGQVFQGLRGTEAHPWLVILNEGNPNQRFFNIASTYIPELDYHWNGEQPIAMFPLDNYVPNASYDSGFLWNIFTMNTPLPKVNCDSFGRFGIFAQSGNELHASAEWLFENPAGMPVSSTDRIPFLRLSVPAAFRVRVTFEVVMHTPPIQVPLTFSFGTLGGHVNCCTPQYQCIYSHDCYGNVGTPLPCHLCKACVHDINRDGSVGVPDLIQVITSWGLCECVPEECAGNLNYDHRVNVDDLLLVILNWGVCPP